MKRLDDFKVANCSLIKIDVEGHEAAVLDGASALMNAQRPTLMVELDERINPGAMQRFTGRLTAHNYQGFFLSRGKLRRIAEFDAAEHVRARAYRLSASTSTISSFFRKREPSKCARASSGTTPRRAPARLPACGSRDAGR
jgi:hypothetical protein